MIALSKCQSLCNLDAGRICCSRMVWDIFASASTQLRFFRLDGPLILDGEPGCFPVVPRVKKLILGYMPASFDGIETMHCLQELQLDNFDWSDDGMVGCPFEHVAKCPQLLKLVVCLPHVRGPDEDRDLSDKFKDTIHELVCSNSLKSLVLRNLDSCLQQLLDDSDLQELGIGEEGCKLEELFLERIMVPQAAQDTLRQKCPSLRSFSANVFVEW